MRFFLGLFLFAAALLFSGCGCNCDKYEGFVSQQLLTYPNQRLLDIYKTVFQGQLGPAHMVGKNDISHIANYIQQEVDSSEEFEDYDFYNLPPDGRYVRVNLKLIKDGRLTSYDLAKSFVRSAAPVSVSEVAAFKEQWYSIFPTLEAHAFSIRNFEADAKYIDILLSEGKYVVHHSDEFIAMYNPHYRIVNRGEFRHLAELAHQKSQR